MNFTAMTKAVASMEVKFRDAAIAEPSHPLPGCSHPNGHPAAGLSARPAAAPKPVAERPTEAAAAPQPQQPAAPPAADATVAAGHIKRPMNAFFMWMRGVRKEMIAAAPSERNGQRSKALAAEWHSMSAEQKAPFEEMARIGREEHRQRHPDYEYRPKKNADATIPQQKAAVRRPAAPCCINLEAMLGEADHFGRRQPSGANGSSTGGPQRIQRSPAASAPYRLPSVASTSRQSAPPQPKPAADNILQKRPVILRSFQVVRQPVTQPQKIDERPAAKVDPIVEAIGDENVPPKAHQQPPVVTKAAAPSPPITEVDESVGHLDAGEIGPDNLPAGLQLDYDPDDWFCDRPRLADNSGKIVRENLRLKGTPPTAPTPTPAPTHSHQWPKKFKFDEDTERFLSPF